MSKKITATSSLLISASLYFGGEILHTAAFCVIFVMCTLDWVALLLVDINGCIAETVRDGFWFNSACSVMPLSAMVATGHPTLAAFSFAGSALIACVAFWRRA